MDLFSTDQIPAEDHIDALQDILGSAMVGIKVREAPSTTLEAKIRSKPLSSTKILTMDATISMSRSHKLMRDLDDGFSLVTCCSGSMELDLLNGEGAQISAGMAILMSHQRPAEIIARENINVNTIILPREMVCQVVRDPHEMTNGMPKGGIAALSLLCGYLGNLFQFEETLSKELQESTLGHLLDLIGYAYDPGGEWSMAAPNNGINAARRQKIVTMLSQNFREFDASAKNFAPQLGLSSRMVHRLLEESGKTFSEHLMNIRLEAAMCMLRDINYNNTKVLDIALSAGFADISYFNRAFRRRYGDTPNTFRTTRLQN